ncbi:MAG: phosphate ABC transporter permease subunit PstC [Candidatus Kapabacteria bacterium]|nr:phosphate ABC transporter permease subunit PstC [Candidatus Kapabacteria bacterium]
MNKDRFYKFILSSSVVVLIALVAVILVLLVENSLMSIKEFSYTMFTKNEWDPVQKSFLLISMPFALFLALFLGEYNTSGYIHNFVKSCVELLAGIPSLIYGFWGLFIFVPMIRDAQMYFGVIPYGVGLLTATLILAIMITPYSASLAQEVIRLVPRDLKEASYALGATRLETIRRIIIPYALSGLFAGVLLSLGRALGETMAVTMVIGNSNFIPKDLFSPANTMSSIIANEFTEATDPLHLSALIEIALILFVTTSVINLLGKYIIKKMVIK